MESTTTELNILKAQRPKTEKAKMEILIDNQHPTPDLAIKKVQAKAKAILNALACPEGELSLVLVNDDTISKYNQQYLGRKGPTNVIAFPMKEGEFSDVNSEILGDVMISVDTCRREAEIADISLQRRFCELLIHGILHLFGYDHVHSEEQALEMEKKSKELLTLLDSLGPDLM
jgi:probable rRNA maturation factor